MTLIDHEEKEYVEQQIKTLLDQNGLKVIEDGGHLYNEYLKTIKANENKDKEANIIKVVNKILSNFIE